MRKRSPCNSAIFELILSLSYTSPDFWTAARETTFSTFDRHLSFLSRSRLDPNCQPWVGETPLYDLLLRLLSSWCSCFCACFRSSSTAPHMHDGRKVVRKAWFTFQSVPVPMQHAVRQLRLALRHWDAGQVTAPDLKSTNSRREAPITNLEQLQH